MKNIMLLFFLLFSGGLMAQSETGPDNSQVNYQLYPDFKHSAPVSEQHIDSMLTKIQRSKSIHGTRPRRVNNAETKHFPAVFNQDGGSCGSASHIGYIFTHGINSYRDADASSNDNVYPTHFTWLFTGHNSDKVDMAVHNGIPNVNVYGGRTYSQLFGNQTNETEGFGWMQGYDKWYSAMSNRAEGTVNFGELGSEEIREVAKNWLWNHAGDEDFHSGGLLCFGVASGGTWERIPTGSYEAGKYYVKYWGKTYDHALTIVGYDDDIEIDLNENGTIEEDEKGAWIIVNSWGNGWCNSGFIYCPYKNAKTTYNPDTQKWGGWIGSEAYIIRKEYKPKRTIKISMNYTRRNELKLSAGISQDITATAPEKTIDFEHFKYGGGATPMLGRWKDGMHNESMEFGYDLTDLSASFDQSKPLKYFFIVNTSSGASGTGIIDYCSIMNYEFDQLGIEIPFTDKNITVQNNGRQTIISVVVSGESVNTPNNLTLTEISANEANLTWDAPEKSYLTLKGYELYRNGKRLISDIPVTQLTYNDAYSNPGDSYQIKAIYSLDDNKIESPLTSAVVREYITDEESALNFSGNGLSIPDVFSDPLPQATIEFWAKPSRTANWNWHIGPGWGTFLFHFNSNGTMSCGYSTSERMDQVSSISANQWAHIAIVINGSEMRLYKNASLVANRQFPNRNGISSIKSFLFGRTTSGSTIGLEGELDELRIWNSARSQSELAANKDKHITYPSREDNLIAYYKMDIKDGKVRDAKGQNHASFLNNNYTVTPQTAFTDEGGEEGDPEAGFTIPEGPHYTGKAISLVNTSSKNATSFSWNAEEAGIENRNVLHPTLIYDEPGTYTVSLKAINGDKSDETNQQITIEALPVPVADFTVPETLANAGKRVSFLNSSTGELCEYKWIFEGGTPTEVYTKDAATIYHNAGKYTVKLIATNASGENTAVKEEIIEIKRIAPIAAFAANKTEVTVGETVQLTDLSEYDPQEWAWTIENDKIMTFNEQNPQVVFNKPGSYSISLVSKNDMGESTSVKEGYITVSSAGAGNALNFDGNDDYVQIQNIFSDDPLKTFTIEWWMYAKGDLSGKVLMANAGGDAFLMKGLANGGVEITFGVNNKVTIQGSTTSPLIDIQKWIHLAMTYDNGTFKIYKNGSAFASRALTSEEVAAWNGLNIGSSANSLDALIDEFRIWTNARTQLDIINALNKPLDNPVLYENLELYYRFDQNSGNVKDEMNTYEGIRTNFGPDGDAWSASGAFNVSLDAYLVEITAPEQDASKASIKFKAGIGTGHAVFIKKSSEASGHPVNEINYRGSNNLSEPGDVIEGSGYICLSSRPNISINITGLEPSTEYDIMIVEYISQNSKRYYLNTSTVVTFRTGIETNDIQVTETNSSLIFQTPDEIIIETGKAGTQTVKLYDMLGRVTYEAVEANNRISINKGNLKEQMYILIINNDERHKVIISR